MEYILITDPDTRAHSVIENSHDFLETFSSYDSAKREGEEWKANKDCKDYAVFVRCSDERNHLV